MKVFFSLIVLFLTIQVDYSQVIDDFSDGDFTQNPQWSGTVADYMVNTNNELQLNSTIASTSYLSTPHLITNFSNVEWRFWLKQSFAPSGSNFGRVYIIANNSDLSTNPDGYFLQLGEGGSTDAVRLMKSVSGVETELVASTDGSIAASFEIGVRVIHDGANNWELLIDFSGGENYLSQGLVNDAALVTGDFMGILGTYTVSNAAKFYYDNVYAGPEIIDVDPPVLTNATVVSATTVDLTFSEFVEQTSAETIANYNLNPTISIAQAQRDIVNLNIVHLTLNSPLQSGLEYLVSSQNIQDFSNNASWLENLPITYYEIGVPLQADVVINELLFNPLTGGSDWVEIYNNSNKYFDLSEWSLARYYNDTISSISPVSSNRIIEPGEFIVLCEDSLQIIQNYPAAILGTFVLTDVPSYNNDSSTVYLIHNNFVVDKVSYTEDWHFKLLDDVDGKSLERLSFDGESDSGDNWHTAAESIGFATPGRSNSQFVPEIFNGELSYLSEVISPDNDGFEDVLVINYKLEKEGLVGTFRIYDDRGREVATLMSSELLAAEGMLTWSGVLEDNSKASIGVYIGVFEVFSIDGDVNFVAKKAFTVAGKL